MKEKRSEGNLLAVVPNRNFIDATAGGGGHAEEIIKRGGRLLGIDLDREVVKIAKSHLAKVCPGGNWRIVKGNFAQIAKIAQKEGFVPAWGVIFDLGLCSYHYRRAKRGFSFKDDQLLDMRISGKGPTAAELIKEASEEELANVFAKFAQERFALQIARAIVKNRRQEKITALWLAKLIEEIYQRAGVKTRLHPATKTFLALRVWVNKEFESLEKGLTGAFAILAPGGRLVVISFHSGEDRLVKSYFKNLVNQKRGKLIVSKPIFPTESEVLENPLSRSAVLRGIEKEG